MILSSPRHLLKRRACPCPRSRHQVPQRAYSACFVVLNCVLNFSFSSTLHKAKQKRNNRHSDAGHISRLQLILSELRMPWKEYLRQKRDEEQRSVEFKRQAEGTDLA